MFAWFDNKVRQAAAELCPAHVKLVWTANSFISTQFKGLYILGCLPFTPKCCVVFHLSEDVVDFHLPKFHLRKATKLI
jgi:hypothetical protein